MKKYIKSASKPVDLSEYVSIGYECLDELRSIIPEIPENPRRKRSHAWANEWYIMFDLNVNLTVSADFYADSKFDVYKDGQKWQEAKKAYLDSILVPCKAITDKYKGCIVDRLGTRGVFGGNSTLTVYTGVKYNSNDA